MTDRKLTVRFTPTGDVEYDFWRSSGIRSYVVEHPFEMTEILEPSSGYRALRTDEGHLRLELPQRPHMLSYRKRGALTPVPGPRDRCFLYEEEIQIKARTHFALWLGSPSGRMSAVSSGSEAIFVSDDRPRSRYRPGDLTEEVFHVSGVLRVRWLLEDLESPRIRG